MKRYICVAIEACDSADTATALSETATFTDAAALGTVELSQATEPDDVTITLNFASLDNSSGLNWHVSHFPGTSGCTGIGGVFADLTATVGNPVSLSDVLVSSSLSIFGQQRVTGRSLVFTNASSGDPLACAVIGSVQACPSDAFALFPLNETDAIVCQNLTFCNETQFESTAPTSSTDRVCTDFTVTCSGSEFESAARTTTSDRQCTAIGACEPKESYEVQAPTNTSNRVCSPFVKDDKVDIDFDNGNTTVFAAVEADFVLLLEEFLPNATFFVTQSRDVLREIGGVVTTKLAVTVVALGSDGLPLDQPTIQTALRTGQFNSSCFSAQGTYML